MNTKIFRIRRALLMALYEYSGAQDLQTLLCSPFQSMGTKPPPTRRWPSMRSSSQRFRSMEAKMLPTLAGEFLYDKDEFQSMGARQSPTFDLTVAHPLVHVSIHGGAEAPNSATDW